jgi:hypothetical protein
MRFRTLIFAAIGGFIVACGEVEVPPADPLGGGAIAVGVTTDGLTSYQTLMDDGTSVRTVQNGDTTSTTIETDSTTGLPILKIVADPRSSTRTVTEYDGAGHPAASSSDVVPAAQVASASAAHSSALPFAQAELKARRPPKPNSAGCDWMHGVDCTSRGKCCDAHDVGIRFPPNNPPCRGSCTNLVYAVLHPNECLRGANNAGCANAHGTVINCFLKAPGPGPSACCARGDCGKPQLCLDPGPPPVVLTRPEECAEIPAP